MAEAVATGLTVSRVAERFGVSYGTVQRACIEHNVTPRLGGRRPGGSLTIRILAALINTSKTQAAIAEELDVTHQRVNQIATEARRAGIRLHPKRRFYRKNGRAAD